MTRRLAVGLAVSHAVVFIATAIVARELTIHLRYSANPTGWWWQ